MSPVIDPKKLGAFIAKHRNAQNMTQATLAEAAGIKRPYLAQIESGKRKPSDKVMEALLIHIKAPLGELIEETTRGAIPDEQTDAMKQLVSTYDALAQVLEPEQLLAFMGQMAPLEQTAASLATLGDQPFDFPPDGWSELNKGDRALVQRLINRLLKDSRAKEADDAD